MSHPDEKHPDDEDDFEADDAIYLICPVCGFDWYGSLDSECLVCSWEEEGERERGTR